MNWDMDVGQEDSRTAIQQRHLGSHSRGISAPAVQSGLHNILLWWNPERGEEFGYADGWTVDGDAFYFSGTGVEGDQRFGHPHQENVRVRDHEDNGDRIRLMRYVGKNLVRYVGELRLDHSLPWSWRDGYDQLGDQRRMIQFRFLPVGLIERLQGDTVRRDPGLEARVAELISELPSPTVTSIESLKSPQFQRSIQAQLMLSQRRELQLVYRFRDWLLEVHSLDATGLLIPYRPEARELRADLYVPVPHLLVEAKSSAAREKIRLALGQLLDYGRWIAPRPRLCVLLPAEPPADMLDLLRSNEVGCAWESEERTFAMNPSALLG